MVTQPPEAEARGALQLLDAYDKAYNAIPGEEIFAGSKDHGLVEMPYGFFPELVGTETLQDPESLKDLMSPISKDPINLLLSSCHLFAPSLSFNLSEHFLPGSPSSALFPDIVSSVFSALVSSLHGGLGLKQLAGLLSTSHVLVA